jgi:excisionase family DNA binding protein
MNRNQQSGQETKLLATNGEPGNYHLERLISAQEAAKFLGGIHPKTLQRMARRQEVPSYRFGRSWFFRLSDLDQWLRSKVRCSTANPSAV